MRLSKLKKKQKTFVLQKTPDLLDLCISNFCLYISENGVVVMIFYRTFTSQ